MPSMRGRGTSTSETCTTRDSNHAVKVENPRGPTVSLVGRQARILANIGGVVMQSCYAIAFRYRFHEGSDPNGIRTRVTAVKGRCPGPLDDRVVKAGQYRIEFVARKANWRRELAFPCRNAGDTLLTDRSQLRATINCAVWAVAPLCCVKTLSALCTSSRRASLSRRSFSAAHSSSSTSST